MGSFVRWLSRVPGCFAVLWCLHGSLAVASPAAAPPPAPAATPSDAASDDTDDDADVDTRDPAIDAAILGEDDAAPQRRVTVEQARARLTFFDQRGRGYQSKAGPPEGPGSERMWVLQPMASITLRQRDTRFSHQVTGAFDMVSAASADAIDAVSSASRYNEAGTVAVNSTFEPTNRDAWTLSYGVHVEEHWRTGFGGFGYSGSFNEDNTVVSASVNLVYDYFDDLHPRGWNDGQTSRWALNDNLTLVQVLSPTTLAMLSYGVTFQTGTLENGWNSVYIEDAPTYGCYDTADQRREYDCPNRRREELPTRRVRHALAAQLGQHIPRTRSTLKARYRHYRDDFDLRAHTLDTWAYQWVGRRLYLRLGYRFHRQSGVAYWTQSITESIPGTAFYTADSDLARFDAHEPSAKLVYYLTPPASSRGGPQSVDVGFSRYMRAQSPRAHLQMNVFSIGYGREF